MVKTPPRRTQRQKTLGSPNRWSVIGSCHSLVTLMWKHCSSAHWLDSLVLTLMSVADLKVEIPFCRASKHYSVEGVGEVKTITKSYLQ